MKRSNHPIFRLTACLHTLFRPTACLHTIFRLTACLHTTFRLTACLFSLVVCVQLNAWKPWPLPLDSADNKQDSVFYIGELSSIISSGKYANFWHVNNRYGQYAIQPFSGNLSAGIIKPMTRPNRWFDYGFAIEAGGRVAKGDNALFIKQLYAQTRLYVIDIAAGIRPMHWGGQDADLSSGGLLFSTNAMPLPGLYIGVEQFTPFPFTYGYLEVKCGFSDLWATGTQLWPNYDVGITGIKLHHKYLGFRVGGKLPVNLSYECHHAAMWGGYSPEYGDLGNSLHDWWNVFWARGGSNIKYEQVNAAGNHLGMQHIQLDIKIAGWQAHAYWQSILEDGPVRLPWYTMNSSDGMWGVCVEQNHWPFISKILYEFVRTTDQSGPYHDRDGVIFGGCDDYFNHYIYKQGWSYLGRCIGTPLITSPIYNQTDNQGFENNRIVAHHFGIMGNIYNYRYRMLYTHSLNYGLYDDNGLYLEKEKHPDVNNALMLEVKKHVEKAWGMDFGVSIAADFGPVQTSHSSHPNSTSSPSESGFGSQFGQSFGIMLSVSKQGLITSWK